MRPPELADRVKELRHERGVTQRELAEITDYSKSAISKCENYRDGDGMTNVRIDVIEQLSGEEIDGPLYQTVD